MSNWMFPVIGANKWSPGSWMPNTQTHRGRTHAAIDIYADRGASIISPVSGHVRLAGEGNIGGNWVQILGDDGVVYYFAHMMSPTELSKGQKVNAGTVIGYVGNTGSASRTSPHVHFSMKRDGKAINPTSYLRSGVVVPNVPDMEELTANVPMGRRIYHGPDSSITAESRRPMSLGLEPWEKDNEPPAWIEQLRQYRENLQDSGSVGTGPKMKAQQVMHNTLASMASLVRQYGFDTGGLPDTGIDESGVTRIEPEQADEGGEGR